nr:caveolin-1 protein [Tanacetum cinerariifolium]
MLMCRLPSHTSCWFLLCFVTLQLPDICCKPHQGDLLYVGKELVKETMPLQSGSRLYHLHGLRQSTWYEVKISYPASVRDLDLPVKRQRKLLNTEKLIFKNDDAEFENRKSGTCVVLTVEPEGVVAIPNAKEREMVVYNI